MNEDNGRQKELLHNLQVCRGNLATFMVYIQNSSWVQIQVCMSIFFLITVVRQVLIPRPHDPQSDTLTAKLSPIRFFDLIACKTIQIIFVHSSKTRVSPGMKPSQIDFSPPRTGLRNTHFFQNLNSALYEIRKIVYVDLYTVLTRLNYRITSQN